MKIGLINNLYKPYQKGGAERVAEILTAELKKLGHTVFIITTRPKIKKDNEESEVYYLKSAYSQLSKWSYLKRWLWQIYNLVNLKKYYQIKKILKTKKPDLVITHNLMGLGLLAPLAIKQVRAKQIHILHDIQLLHPAGLIYYHKEKIINSGFAKIYQGIVRLLFSLGSSKLIIISPSNWLLNLHLVQGLFKNNKTKVILNPLSENQAVHCQDSKNFIFVGQLEYHKGLDLFISAASKFTNYNFLIVGDGSMYGTITETANLKLLGQKSSPEVSKLLSNSLAVIVPSRCYENSPTVIYEAAAVGTPAIVANLGGAPELVERFGGLLFEPANLTSLIMTISEFITKGIKLKTLPASENYAEKILAQL